MLILADIGATADAITLVTLVAVAALALYAPDPRWRAYARRIFITMTAGRRRRR